MQASCGMRNVRRIGLLSSSSLWIITAQNLCVTAFLGQVKPPVCRGFCLTSQKLMSSLFEIEEKFQLSDSQDLEQRLQTLGFKQAGPEKTFTDWYYDSKEDNSLTLSDHWFRCREINGQGTWELKRGRGENTSSTVYEEIQGTDAIEIILAMTPENTISTGQIDKEFDDFSAPTFEGLVEHGIIPFCRLETRRSSWQIDQEDTQNEFLGLQVDLDVTDTGHSVGEVECVVDDETQVLEAKKRVENLVAILSKGSKSDGPAIGKLEHFLIKNRPDHYQACVTAGVIKNKV